MAAQPNSPSSAAQDGGRELIDAEIVVLEDELGGPVRGVDSGVEFGVESGAAAARARPAPRRATQAARRSPAAAATEQPPVTWREIIGLIALVVLSDAAIYHSHGFAGPAAFFALAPLLLTFAAPRPRRPPRLWLLSAMIAVLAARLVWCGTALQVAVGVPLLAAFAMTLAGQRPYILELLAYIWQALPAGVNGLLLHARGGGRLGRPVLRLHWLGVILPAAALVIFSVLFTLANPDLLSAFGENLEYVLTRLHDWLAGFMPTPLEVGFWLAVLCIALGLLRPLLRGPLLREASAGAGATTERKPAPAPLYAAYRNTLLAVIVLFAVYLAFEFKTLWFRQFPEGFYYSGYAHEGAAWLTAALAVATLLLSLIFRGAILRDARVGNLRRLAWLWSLENFLLAVAVYHRLYIYIGFNGMTRMRVVGILGITAVVIGFSLVLYKIARGRSFLWLLRSQLTALALVVFVYAAAPVDYLVVNYNVRRILAGDPAPSVQITEHPISAEGVASLTPLLDCDDAIIRDGVAALLAARQEQLQQQVRRNEQLGWTTLQIADRLALKSLQAQGNFSPAYNDRAFREEVYRRFRDYAYQWY